MSASLPEDETLATGLFTDPASGELKERRFRLVVTSGPDRGGSHPLDGGTVLVGSHPDNDLVLTDRTVSRYHLELQVRRDGIKITDLETTNGTRHAGIRLGSIVATGPTRLQLGKHTEIELVPEDQAVELSLYPGDRFGQVIGSSPAMRGLFALLERVAATDATLLLEGETGTGKEAIAEEVHRHSPRRDRPFVVVDCGAIPRELIGSELFGHVRGAYTGACADKKGLIEAASGGTLFLDEIGELALDLQPQLLRALEKREVRRVGDTRASRVDIRVVAATNRDLRAMCKQGRFREDLYFRLAVVRAVVPPLRARRDDVARLAHHFAGLLGKGSFALSAHLVEELSRHDWPGNVRELRNVVERALSLGHAGLGVGASGALAPSAAAVAAVPRHAPPAPPGGPRTPGDILERPFKEAKNALVENFERDYLAHLLDRHHGNVSRAAAEAGIDRNYIHRLVKKYNIRIPRR